MSAIPTCYKCNIFVMSLIGNGFGNLYIWFDQEKTLKEFEKTY